MHPQQAPSIRHAGSMPALHKGQNNLVGIANTNRRATGPDEGEGAPQDIHLSPDAINLTTPLAPGHAESDYIGLQSQSSLYQPKWTRFTLQKNLPNPHIDIITKGANRSPMSLQREAKQSLHKKILERQHGLIQNQNPILADQYEHKLKNLSNYMDLVQEGKMTYKSFKSEGIDVSDASLKSVE